MTQGLGKFFMGKAPKPDLDETTLQIARRMLSTPPKPHDEMKLGKVKRRPGKPSPRPRSAQDVDQKRKRLKAPR
jgi:hypothetical protein